MFILTTCITALFHGGSEVAMKKSLIGMWEGIRVGSNVKELIFPILPSHSSDIDD